MSLEWAKRHLPQLAALLVIIASVYGLYALLTEIRYHDIVHEIRGLTNRQLLMALGFTALSYGALACSEVVSILWAKIPVKAARAALVGLVSQSIVHTTGFGLLLGTSLRYRLYARDGVKLTDVARAQFYFSSGFGLATLALLALALLRMPPEILVNFGNDKTLLASLGVGLALFVGTLLLWSFSQKSFTVFKHTLTPPRIGTSLPLVLLGALDLMACCAVLFVLLPAGLNVSYAYLLMVFLAAIVLCLVSHVPGGLGVFEATVLLLLAPAPSLMAPTVGALLVYRALYYLLPFALSALYLSLSFREAVQRAGRMFMPLVPTTSALLTMLSGVLLIFSGVTPVERGRLALLGDWLPNGLIEASHLFASLIGVVLLVIAHGLFRRLQGAWLLAVFLSGLGAVLALLKGFEVGVAVMLFSALLILLPARRAFYRQSSLRTDRLSAPWWLALFGVLIATYWLLLFGYRHVEYRDELWWQFELHAEASRSLRATLGTALLILILALRALLQPAKMRPPLPAPAALDEVATFLDATPFYQGRIALTGDKYILWNAEKTAYLMYGVQGRTWASLGEPIGAPDNWGDLLWDFLSLVDRNGGRAAFYQTGSENLPQFIDLGLHPFKIGEAALIPLETFSLEGGRRANLRAGCHKLRKAGGTFEVLQPGIDDAQTDALEAISNSWLDRHSVREKRFSVGFFDRAYIRRTPVAVVKVAGEIVAFANLWLGAKGETLSIDMMRYGDKAPSGTMDYLLTQILFWAKEQGYKHFDLGIAPLSGLPEHRLAGNWAQVARLIANHGERLYNFGGLRAYKEKFDPIWQPVYLVCKPSQLMRVLLDIASLISSGVGGLVKK